jgi:hypothetical protein
MEISESGLLPLITVCSHVNPIDDLPLIGTFRCFAGLVDFKHPDPARVHPLLAIVLLIFDKSGRLGWSQRH